MDAQVGWFPIGCKLNDPDLACTSVNLNMNTKEVRTLPWDFKGEKASQIWSVDTKAELHS